MCQPRDQQTLPSDHDREGHEGLALFSQPQQEQQTAGEDVHLDVLLEVAQSDYCASVIYYNNALCVYFDTLQVQLAIRLFPVEVGQGIFKGSLRQRGKLS